MGVGTSSAASMPERQRHRPYGQRLGLPVIRSRAYDSVRPQSRIHLGTGGARRATQSRITLIDGYGTGTFATSLGNWRDSTESKRNDLAVRPGAIVLRALQVSTPEVRQDMTNDRWDGPPVDDPGFAEELQAQLDRAVAAQAALREQSSQAERDVTVRSRAQGKVADLLRQDALAALQTLCSVPPDTVITNRKVSEPSPPPAPELRRTFESKSTYELRQRNYHQAFERHLAEVTRLRKESAVHNLRWIVRARYLRDSRNAPDPYGETSTTSYIYAVTNITDGGDVMVSVCGGGHMREYFPWRPPLRAYGDAPATDDELAPLELIAPADDQHPELAAVRVAWRSALLNVVHRMALPVNERANVNLAKL